MNIVLWAIIVRKKRGEKFTKKSSLDARKAFEINFVEFFAKRY